MFKAAANRIRSALNNVRASFSLIPDWYANVRFTLQSVFLALTQKGYKQNPVVYACIRLLAESAPEPPLRVYALTKEGEVELPDHPLRKLISRPNDLQTEFEFVELVTIQLNICGRSHWWKERKNNGEVLKLWPLRPDRISPIYGKGMPPLVGWYYDLDGQLFQLPAADVVTFNYPDPEDPSGGVVEGLGPLQVLARTVETDNKATTFVHALLHNYAMPGVLIKTKKSLSKKEAEQMKEKFKLKYGNMNLGDPAILDADTDVETLSFNLRDLEFPDLRSVDESRIAAAFRTPAELVGLKVGLEHSTYSNKEEARLFFTETTLSTLWTRFANQMQVDMVPEYKDGATLIVRFDTSKVRALQKQQTEKAKRYYDGMVQGGVTLNEYRQKALDLPPVAGGDVFYVPSGKRVTATPWITEQPPAQLQGREKVQITGVEKVEDTLDDESKKDYTPDRLATIKGLLSA